CSKDRDFYEPNPGTKVREAFFPAPAREIAEDTAQTHRSQIFQKSTSQLRTPTFLSAPRSSKRRQHEDMPSLQTAGREESPRAGRASPAEWLARPAENQKCRG